MRETPFFPLREPYVEIIETKIDDPPTIDSRPPDQDVRRTSRTVLFVVSRNTEMVNDGGPPSGSLVIVRYPLIKEGENRPFVLSPLD